MATARKIETLDYLPESDDILKLSLDVTSQQSIDNAYEATLQKFGRIDFLVNNAGYNKMGVTEAVPESDLRDMFETNYWGAVRMTTKVLPIFRQENKATGKIGGTVIQVSSIGGRMAYPASAGYHSSWVVLKVKLWLTIRLQDNSKAALEAYTDTISQEVDPAWNTRFLILEPGGTKSDYAGKTLSDWTKHDAYDNPDLFLNQMFKAMTGPNFEDHMAPAEAVAKLAFDVAQLEKIPLRLPTGKDAYQILLDKDSQKLAELKEWKTQTESVSG